MTRNFLEKMQCCGCGACYSACPKNCIFMEWDNEGFSYPVVDEDKCIKCHICKKVCPIKYPVNEEYFEQEAYLVQNRDRDTLKSSTSGGFFSALAENVVLKGGIVYGAVLDEDLQVKHIGICDIDELWRFRKSKYVQSNLKDTYKEAKKELDEGYVVCYSGTPCQIEGLKKFVGKDYKNLITCDVVCHSVPSPLILSKYVEYIEQKEKDRVANLFFRDKSAYGYKYNVVTAFNEKGKMIYQCGVESDPYCRAFFSDISVRPSCYSCAFKKQYRVSDFTIWDAFNVGKFSKELDNDIGTTKLLIHTLKGRDCFKQIREKFTVCQVSSERLTAGTREMYKSVRYNIKREDFFKDAISMTGTELFKKHFSDSVKIKLERTCRRVCIQIGIYSYIKNMVNVIKNAKCEKKNKVDINN